MLISNPVFKYISLSFFKNAFQTIPESKYTSIGFKLRLEISIISLFSKEKIVLNIFFIFLLILSLSTNKIF